MIKKKRFIFKSDQNECFPIYKWTKQQSIRNQDSLNIPWEQMWVCRHHVGEGKVRWEPECICDHQWGGGSPEWAVLGGRTTEEDTTVSEMTLNFWRLSFRKRGTWGTWWKSSIQYCWSLVSTLSFWFLCTLFFYFTLQCSLIITEF